ncbi:hypothetical protein ACHAAC_01880 [Aeromicrobium sp. CF4.19]|uniref:hypothetical protein n=1 Tax=Aeromicrobium sp. CF4.19 TaxID=3373082 RepID=UPI003EE68C4D
MTLHRIAGSARLRIVLAAAVVVGVMPYLVLKLVWMGGGRVGLLDPDFGTSSTMMAANALTVVMEGAAVALAVTCAARWRHRVPSPVLLAPLWVGTGLLAPVLVIVPLQVVLGTPERAPSETAPIADWVFLMVYAGFLWQGVALLTLLGLLAHERWGHVARLRSVRTRVHGTTLLALTLLTATAVLVPLDARRHPPVSWPNLLGDTSMVLVAAAGLLLLHLGRGPRWGAALALWVGSSAVTASGAYQLVLATVPNDLAPPGGTAWDVVAPAVSLVAGITTVLAVRLTAGRTDDHRPHRPTGPAPAQERRDTARPVRKTSRPTPASPAPTTPGAR